MSHLNPSDQVIDLRRKSAEYYQKAAWNQLLALDNYRENNLVAAERFAQLSFIEPRFGNSFLYDVIKAIKSDDKHLSEIIDIFRDFVKLTLIQKYLPLKRKLKWLLYFAIIRLPKQPLKVFFLLLDFNKMR